MRDGEARGSGRVSRQQSGDGRRPTSSTERSGSKRRGRDERRGSAVREWLLLGFAGTSLAGCMTSPSNGNVSTNNDLSVSRTFSGVSNVAPGAPVDRTVHLQVQ